MILFIVWYLFFRVCRANNETAAAHAAAMGVSGVWEGGRRSGGGTRSSSGSAMGPDGGGDGDAGSSDDHKASFFR